VTPAGERALIRFGADLSPRGRGVKMFCRPCLDWSERRYHLSGHVGSEICRRCFELGWLVRVRDARAVTVTPSGRAGMRDTFGLDVGDGTIGRAGETVQALSA
jgi:hypothetical protein